MPRRIIVMGMLIFVFVFIKWGLSAAVFVTGLKLILAAYLFSTLIRMSMVITLARLMASNHKVAIEDIAYAVYVKGHRYDQLQMIDDLGTYLESIKGVNNNPV